MSSSLYPAIVETAQSAGASPAGRGRKLSNDALRLTWSLRPRGYFCEPHALVAAATGLAGSEAAALAVQATALPLRKLGPIADAFAQMLKAQMPRAVSLAELGRIGQCDMDTHDAYFGIARCDRFDARVLLGSQVMALSLLHKDLRGSATRVHVDRLRLLEQGLRLCIARVTGMPAPSHIMPLPRSSTPTSEASSARRWLRGHHMFAVLSQGLILCFSDISKMHASGETEKAVAAAEAAAFLLRASAASLEFTGDMPPEHYNNIVRIAMAPPIMPPGFSGLHSRDHRHLVKCMKDAKDALEALKLSHPDVYAGIPAALTEVYDSHKLVCSAFLGNSERSLLMASEAPISGAEQLENFKRSRLRMIGVRTQGASS